MVLKFLAPEPSRNILSCLNLQKILKRFLFLKWFLCLVLLQNVSVWAQVKDEQDSSSNNPVPFKVLDSDDISRVNLGQDVPVILSMTPSVNITSDAGNGIGYTGMSIRGSDGSRINVTINGVPLNDSESHATYWVDLPDFASSISSIQIQRGVGTSTNGSGAFAVSYTHLTLPTSDLV